MIKDKFFSLNNYNNSWSWKFIVIGITTFFLFPPIGSLSFFLALIIIGKQEYKTILKNNLTKIFCLFSIWLIVTSFLAYKPTEAFLGLANFLPFIALFLTFQVIIKNLDQLFLIAWLIVYPSIPIVFLGLGQLYFNWNTPTLFNNISGWELILNGYPEGRMSSIFSYANLLTLYLLISLTLTIGLSINFWQNNQKLLKKNAYFLSIMYLFSIFVADVVGLVLTNSRSGWAIAIIIFIIFGIYVGWYWLVAIITAVIGMIAIASFGNFRGQNLMRKIIPAYFWQRLTDENYQRPVETLRLTQWKFAVKMTIDKPIFGWGLRNFSPLYETQNNIYIGHPHNIFLMLSSETGIIGLLGISSIISLIFYQTINTLNNLRINNNKKAQLILFTYLIAFTSCILFNCFDSSIFDLRMNTTGWFLLACLSGFNQKSR